MLSSLTTFWDSHFCVSSLVDNFDTCGLFARLENFKLSERLYVWLKQALNLCSSCFITVSIKKYETKTQRNKAFLALVMTELRLASESYIWNSLPLSVRHSSSLSSFKSKLKTHHFSSASWSVIFFSLYQPITSNACIGSVCVCVSVREGVCVCVMKWAYPFLCKCSGLLWDGAL